MVTEAEADEYCNGEELTAPPPVTEKELISDALSGIRKNAAPGVDGMTIALIMLVIQIIRPTQGVATRGFFPGPDCVGGIRDRWLSFQVVQVVTGQSFLNDSQVAHDIY